MGLQEKLVGEFEKRHGRKARKFRLYLLVIGRRYLLQNGYVPSSDSSSIQRSPNRTSWAGYLLLSTILAASSLTSVKDNDDDEASTIFWGFAGRPVATIIGTAYRRGIPKARRIKPA